MARIKLAYIGGGGTRGPGTMASMIEQGENFSGSEIVLIDLDADHLALVKQLSDAMIRQRGLDVRVSVTTDRRQGLVDCDAVLTSYRPGDFQARVLDESLPLRHNLIGQETQGPGGFFMALRAIHVMRDIIRDMEAICPSARLFNYTNPINIVSEAITHHSAIATVSLCEGPIVFPREIAVAAGLDPAKVDVVMVGLNHASWSVRHTYDGQDMMPLIQDAFLRRRDDPSTPVDDLRFLQMAATMESIPARYFQYYYFRDEILAELQARPTTRAQDILASVPDYWQHYRQQAVSAAPHLDPARSRGGIYELELAIDVMDAVFNDRKEIWPVNVPNCGALSDFPDDRVVEVPGLCDRHGVRPLQYGALPRAVVGLTSMLGEYQSLAAEAAWSGDRKQAIRALAANPLVLSINRAETMYNELAHAHRAYLPERLLR